MTFKEYKINQVSCWVCNKYVNYSNHFRPVVLINKERIRFS